MGNWFRYPQPWRREAIRAYKDNLKSSEGVLTMKNDYK
jgi:hypothetical protein